MAPIAGTVARQEPSIETRTMFGSEGSFHLGARAPYALRMSGADFVRADLHVHTFADNEVDPRPNVESYVVAALTASISVLGITDHNTTRFGRAYCRRD